MPGASSYMGCVGDDEFAAEMTTTAAQDGVNVSGGRGRWRQHTHTPHTLHLAMQQCQPYTHCCAAALALAAGAAFGTGASSRGAHGSACSE